MKNLFLQLLYVVLHASLLLLLDFLLEGLSPFGWAYLWIHIVSISLAAFYFAGYCIQEAQRKLKPLQGFLIGLLTSLSGLFIAGLIFGAIGLWHGLEQSGFSLDLLDGALWVSLLNMIFAFVLSPFTLLLGGIGGMLYSFLLHFVSPPVIEEIQDAVPGMLWPVRQLALVSISAGLVWYSLLIPVRVDSREALKEIEFGYPMTYVEQNQTKYSYGYPPESPGFPLWLSPASPWENGTNAKALPFLLNIVLIYTLISLFSGGIFRRISPEGTT